MPWMEDVTTVLQPLPFSFNQAGIRHRCAIDACHMCNLFLPTGAEAAVGLQRVVLRVAISDIKS